MMESHYDLFTIEPLELEPPFFPVYMPPYPIERNRVICKINRIDVKNLIVLDATKIYNIIGKDYADRMSGEVRSLLLNTGMDTYGTCCIFYMNEITRDLYIISNLMTGYAVFVIRREHDTLEMLIYEKGRSWSGVNASINHFYITAISGLLYVYRMNGEKVLQCELEDIEFTGIGDYPDEPEIILMDDAGISYTARYLSDLWRQRHFVDVRSKYYEGLRALEECQRRYNAPDDVMRLIATYLK